jgi:NADPH2:quinone reductase
MDGAIVVARHGPPEVLTWTSSDPGAPGPGEVLVRHTAVGVNFVDVYHRTGFYPLELPFTPGVEAAGVVEALGDGVDDLAPGDRVAYTGNGPVGSYREGRVLPRGRLVRLPDAVDDVTAAAIMLKGCTVEYLVRRTVAVKPGDRVLLHAAAGGVGLIACQWLDALGATVIGTVGTEEKAGLAKAHGCHHTILYREEDVAARVDDVTDGRGVDVVYDAVGADTFESSLDTLRSRGTMVSFGNASGPVPPISPLVLLRKGSLFLTRPSLQHYYDDPEEAAQGFAALFEMVTTGKLRVHVGQTFPLRDVAKAHAALEARETVGSTVLMA